LLDQADGESVVVLRGDLDLAAEPEVLGAIEAAEAGDPRCIVIDVSGLTFMGSCGVRWLLEAAERARADRRELALIPGPATEKVLALTGVADRFTYR
jgi:anti-anti-sigma factor